MIISHKHTGDDHGTGDAENEANDKSGDDEHDVASLKWDDFADCCSEFVKAVNAELKPVASLFFIVFVNLKLKDFC